MHKHFKFRKRRRNLCTPGEQKKINELQGEETDQAIARRAQKQNCLCELPAAVQTGSAQTEELHREAHASS